MPSFETCNQAIFDAWAVEVSVTRGDEGFLEFYIVPADDVKEAANEAMLLCQEIRDTTPQDEVSVLSVSRKNELMVYIRNKR